MRKYDRNGSSEAFQELEAGGEEPNGGG
ncbi:hypothetical protein GBAR_LOCUS27553 [Geodia barretti]|uniref:Uncharacterized protein n=1 Tax=Geodia barretti TaxID=519541 RepID=A0AA35TN74_GEOBA|nr:hypothetical protein GBAR_LOCUS27553 [Geodia barretti]